MADITFSTGVVEMSVNGKRTIRFNPTDFGFMDTLYSLIAKVDAIGKDCERKLQKSTSPEKDFDYYRAADKQMKKAVDDVFGDGFSDDVFDGVRLIAWAGDGLTVLESFVFAVIDHMDGSVRENMERRNAKIESYTAKYKNRRAKAQQQTSDD